ncbi:MAG TPA: hypothetical protein VIK78_08035 [Ruminiclostridium sp.]
MNSRGRQLPKQIYTHSKRYRALFFVGPQNGSTAKRGSMHRGWVQFATLLAALQWTMVTIWPFSK